MERACALALAWLGASALAQARGGERPHEPPELIPDAAALAHPDETAWRLLIALSGPAPQGSPSADPQAPADRPGVWESWKNINEILRPDGADPGPWEATPPKEASVPSSAAARFEALSGTELPQLRHIVHGKMVPVTAPLLHPQKLIEVRFNRVSFEHIRAHELYCLEGQLRQLATGVAVSFPRGAIQLKASWRPVTPEQQRRYHTLSVARPDGTRALYGLTALNMAVKGTPEGTSSSWLWTAFEQEDNAQRVPGEGWQLPSHDAFACPEAPTGCDHAPRGLGLEGTVWEHYRLRGTLRTYLDAAGAPQRLASSELEAGLQESSSCSTCHSRATIGRASTGTVTRLPVFQSAAPQAPRQGFVGLPDPAWFRPVDAQGVPQAAYVGLDFVWSLARAAPRAHSNGGQ